MSCTDAQPPWTPVSRGHAQDGREKIRLAGWKISRKLSERSLAGGSATANGFSSWRHVKTPLVCSKFSIIGQTTVGGVDRGQLGFRSCV